MKDLSSEIGKVYGSWTIIKQVGSSQRKILVVMCRCSCGQESKIEYSPLTRGITTKCRPCADRTRTIKHGMSYHYLYTIWCSIRGRCHNIKHPQFFYYGARDIRLFESWHDPKVFINDVIDLIGERPIKEGTIYQLDRADVHKFGNRLS